MTALSFYLEIKHPIPTPCVRSENKSAVLLNRLAYRLGTVIVVIYIYIFIVDILASVSL